MEEQQETRSVFQWVILIVIFFVMFSVLKVVLGIVMQTLYWAGMGILAFAATVFILKRIGW
jgi:hypothetical protein